MLGRLMGWTTAVPAEAAMAAGLARNKIRSRDYGLYELASNLGVTVGLLMGGWLSD